MKTKTIIRVVGIIMLMAMLLTTFASCKKKNEDGAGDGTAAGDAAQDAVSTESSEVDTGRYDKNGYLMDDLPEDLQYPGQEITVLAWSDSIYTEFDVKELTQDDEIENSIYLRDRTIEARLGVTIKYEMTVGSVKKIQEYKTKVQDAYLGQEPYDIIASYTRSTALCASAGFMLDLNSVQGSYINIDKPWWNKDLVETTKTSKDKYYMLTGDASTSLAQMIYCVYFNADAIANTKGLTSPYTLVENNQWTIETMRTMTKNYYNDKGGETGADLNDQLAVVGSYYAWPALLHGCGVGYVTRDTNRDFVLDENIRNDKGLNLMNNFLTWVKNEGCFVSESENESADNFKKNNTMFLLTHSGTGLHDLQEVNFEVGVVPCPKYDASQETYYSTVRQPVTFFGIMANVPAERHVMLTAFLECWASEGYRQTTPVIFEQSMKYKGTANPKIPQMLQLIKDTAWFDVARIYADETNYIVDKPGRYLQQSKPWEGYINGDLNLVINKLVILNLDLNK